MLEYTDNTGPINIRIEGEPFIHSIATIEIKSKRMRSVKVMNGFTYIK